MSSYPAKHIVSTTAFVKVNEPFFIQLKETPYTNFAWDISFTLPFRLVNTKRYFSDTVDTREWEIVATMPGQYTLSFKYRKQCCEGTLLDTKTYTITVM